MTDKERLEEFKDELDFLDDSADMEDYHRFIDSLKNLYEGGELNWIYRYAKEQANRADKNAQDSEDMDRQLYNTQLQNERYREILGFYADRNNYKPEHFDPNIVDYMSTVDYDEGQKAREELGESE